MVVYVKTWPQAQDIAKHQRSLGFSVRVKKLKRPRNGKNYSVERLARVECHGCGRRIGRDLQKMNSLYCGSCLRYR